MANGHGRPHMGYNTVQLVHMLLITILLSNAFVAETLEHHGRWYEAVYLLHAATEALQLQNQETWQDVVGDRSDGFGFLAARFA